jgi:cell wall-associated NlpC family hydrolase
MNLEHSPVFFEWLATPYKDRGRDLRGWDCWGLVYFISRTYFRRMVPSYLDAYESAEQGKSVASAIWTHSPAWLRLPDDEAPLTGDVVVFNLGGSPIHCGMVAKPSHMLHCLEGRDTCLERYDTAGWRDRVEGTYRWMS